MGFAYLSSLESKLSTLQSQLSSDKTKLEAQKKRHSNVEAIINDMKRICGNRTDDVNYCLRKVVSNIGEAAQGISLVNELAEQISTDKERDMTDDGNLNSAFMQLRDELADVDNKIHELESKTRRATSEVSAYQASIRKEKRNIANDYHAKLRKAQERVNLADEAYKADPKSETLRLEFQKACQERDEARSNYNKYKKWM